MDLFSIERILLILEKTIFVESHLIALSVPPSIHLGIFYRHSFKSNMTVYYYLRRII